MDHKSKVEDVMSRLSNDRIRTVEIGRMPYRSSRTGSSLKFEASLLSGYNHGFLESASARNFLVTSKIASDGIYSADAKTE